jgi:hypothetical protein
MAKTGSVDRPRYWRKVIERQRTCGQSIVGFCSKEGLGKMIPTLRASCFGAGSAQCSRPVLETSFSRVLGSLILRRQSWTR